MTFVPSKQIYWALRIFFKLFIRIFWNIYSSMDDDNSLCCFGTPLDPIEEGVVSAKRITLADQIAVDSDGKRRFHGAFTGGFSAGFWNTVGSREGWTPSEFKSSRNEKAAHRAQLPSDFMDDEDIGEYGIAPQRIQTTDDFTESNKRSTQKRKPENSLGPIPGVPVLELVLESCRDKAAIRLLKRMDSKYAKKLMGRTEDTKNIMEVINEELNQSGNIAENEICDDGKDELQPKVYQCDLGPIQRLNRCEHNSDSDSDIEIDQLIADSGEFATVLDNMKTNRFGLDYSGLYKGNFFTIMGAEAPQRASGSNALSKLTITDKNNKSVTINGQAFGVGAFEEDDDDIYDREDMSKYDFRLETKIESSKTKQITSNANHFIEGFNVAANKSIMNNIKRVYKIQLPFKFEPRNWLIRKTRFGPEVVVPEKIVVGRHDLVPSERGKILNETIPTKSTKEHLLGISIDEKLKAARMKVVEFASSSKTILFDGEDNESDAIASKTFSQTIEKIDSFKVPESLPLIGDRFTSAGDVSELKALLPVKEIAEKPKPLKEIQKVIRTKSKWLPSQLLCYKMNMESAVGTKPDKQNAFSLFECINVTSETRRKTELEFTGSLHGGEKQNEFKANIVPKVPRMELTDSKEKQLNDARPVIATSDREDQAFKVQQTMKPPIAAIRKPLKPKTELEQKILETQDEHPSKKKDLFKAIFDSDSDGDDDDIENEEKSVSENKSDPILEFKGQLSTMAAADTVYSSIPDDAFMPKSAKEINVLRNTSPPRGIFKSLAEMEPSRKLKVTIDTNNDTPCESIVIPDSYGPSLPPANARLDIVPVITETNRVTITSSESSDEWIERTSSKKKKKSSKKHKTEKHKKKKSKKSKKRHS